MGRRRSQSAGARPSPLAVRPSIAAAVFRASMGPHTGAGPLVSRRRPRGHAPATAEPRSAAARTTEASAGCSRQAARLRTATGCQGHGPTPVSSGCQQVTADVRHDTAKASVTRSQGAAEPPPRTARDRCHTTARGCRDVVNDKPHDATAPMAIASGSCDRKTPKTTSRPLAVIAVPVRGRRPVCRRILRLKSHHPAVVRSGERGL